MTTSSIAHQHASAPRLCLDQGDALIQISFHGTSCTSLQQANAKRCAPPEDVILHPMIGLSLRSLDVSADLPGLSGCSCPRQPHKPDWLSSPSVKGRRTATCAHVSIPYSFGYVLTYLVSGVIQAFTQGSQNSKTARSSESLHTRINVTLPVTTIRERLFDFFGGGRLVEDSGW